MISDILLDVLPDHLHHQIRSGRKWFLNPSSVSLLSLFSLKSYNSLNMNKEETETKI